MNGKIKKTIQDSVMAEVLSKETLQIPKMGDVIEGKVIEIGTNIMYVDLGNFKTGVVLGKEFRENPQYFKNIKVGDEVTAKILETENEEGYTEISLKEAGEERGWRELEKKMKADEVIKTKILKANKGGLMVEINGIPGFLPVSQLSSKHYPRIEGGDKQKILQELNKFAGQNFEVKIIDISQKEKRLIVSEKAAQEKELKEVLNKYKVGSIIEGTITGVAGFGVFVKFDNLEGLVHISELDWQLIENPHDIVKVGEKIKAKLIGIEDDRISLSMKKLKKNPWEDVEKKYQRNQLVKGTVTKFNPFGVFIQLDKYIHGLVHISEFKTEEKMKEMLEIGKKYDFKILSIEPKEYRMALGLVQTPALKKEVKIEEKEQKRGTRTKPAEETEKIKKAKEKTNEA